MKNSKQITLGSSDSTAAGRLKRNVNVRPFRPEFIYDRRIQVGINKIKAPQVLEIPESVEIGQQIEEVKPEALQALKISESVEVGQPIAVGKVEALQFLETPKSLEAGQVAAFGKLEALQVLEFYGGRRGCSAVDS
jgi:hypothetical protein